MRQVTIREFHVKMWDEIKDLPVEVTRNNIPIFDVVPVGQKILEKKIVDVKDVPVQVPFVKCSFFNCKEEAVATGKQYNEGSMDWEDVPMCQPHAVKSLKEMLK